MIIIYSKLFLFVFSIYLQGINEWKYIFNGESLDGWEIKIRNYEMGVNYNNTFKVQDGSLKISYENYDLFEDKFGHIFFTDRIFKNYHLSLEYKFSGNHLEDAPNWSLKNSGIMLHSQDPKSMLIDQDFPVSAEFQLLGGINKGDRPTANICTPGTDVDIDGIKAEYHCINSTSLTFNEDDWIHVEAIVYSDSLIHHLVEKDTVLTYTNIRVGGEGVPKNYILKESDKLSEGYISLQSEGHPVEFRNIKIRELNK